MVVIKESVFNVMSLDSKVIILLDQRDSMI